MENTFSLFERGKRLLVEILKDSDNEQCKVHTGKSKSPFILNHSLRVEKYVIELSGMMPEIEESIVGDRRYQYEICSSWMSAFPHKNVH